MVQLVKVWYQILKRKQMRLMSKYCDAILVNERNLGKSGEKGASQAEPEAGYLG